MASADKISLLNFLSWVCGTITVVYGIIRFLSDGSIASLCIAGAILTVGPLEDLLTSWVRSGKRQSAGGGEGEKMVDSITNLLFVLWLLAAVRFA
ncbi:MAG TPA: hypothetical protein GXX29_13205 [Firmicutes bacterium]|nr:hypothetical protein [Bacillota bacterium]